MESASACLPLAFALLLCFASFVGNAAESRTYESNQGKSQRANEGKETTWCIAKPAAEAEKLSRNIEYSCAQKGVDCRAIQPGGSCFNPDSIISHASYAMNLYYKFAGKHRWDCHFDATGMIVIQDPSSDTCKYPV